MTEETVSTGKGNEQNTEINPDADVPAEAGEGMTSLAAADQAAAEEPHEELEETEAAPEEAAPAE